MGEPMLAALHHAGLPASGFDIRAAQTYPTALKVTDDPKRIPQNTETLISVVRDIPQTEDNGRAHH